MRNVYQHAFVDQSSSQSQLARVVQARKVTNGKLRMVQGETERVGGTSRKLDRAPVVLEPDYLAFGAQVEDETWPRAHHVIHREAVERRDLAQLAPEQR